MKRIMRTEDYCNVGSDSSSLDGDSELLLTFLLRLVALLRLLLASRELLFMARLGFRLLESHDGALCHLELGFCPRVWDGNDWLVDTLFFTSLFCCLGIDGFVKGHRVLRMQVHSPGTLRLVGWSLMKY
jgi:hypothetical protein